MSNKNYIQYLVELTIAISSTVKRKKIFTEIATKTSRMLQEDIIEFGLSLEKTDNDSLGQLIALALRKSGYPFKVFTNLGFSKKPYQHKMLCLMRIHDVYKKDIRLAIHYCYDIGTKSMVIYYRRETSKIGNT